MSVAFVQRGRPPPTPVQIQKMLDENSHLIQSIQEFQSKGKISECMQYQQILHRNLVYLASIADANQNIQALLPPPGQVPQHGVPVTAAPPANESSSTSVPAQVFPQQQNFRSPSGQQSIPPRNPSPGQQPFRYPQQQNYQGQYGQQAQGQGQGYIAPVQQPSNGTYSSSQGSFNVSAYGSQPNTQSSYGPPPPPPPPQSYPPNTQSQYSQQSAYGPPPPAPPPPPPPAPPTSQSSYSSSNPTSQAGYQGSNYQAPPNNYAGSQPPMSNSYSSSQGTTYTPNPNQPGYVQSAYPTTSQPHPPSQAYSPGPSSYGPSGPSFTQAPATPPQTTYSPQVSSAPSAGTQTYSQGNPTPAYPPGPMSQTANYPPPPPQSTTAAPPNQSGYQSVQSQSSTPMQSYQPPAAQASVPPSGQYPSPQTQNYPAGSQPNYQQPNYSQHGYSQPYPPSNQYPQPYSRGPQMPPPGPQGPPPPGQYTYDQNRFPNYQPPPQ